MSETFETIPTWGKFKGFAGIFVKNPVGLRRRRSIRAANELAAISGMRADAHGRANLFRVVETVTARQKGVSQGDTLTKVPYYENTKPERKEEKRRSPRI